MNDRREQSAALYERHRRELLTYVTRLVVRPQIAEELVQETAVRMLAATAMPSEPVEARAWLFKLATNLAIDYLRRHSTWRELVLVDTKERCARDEAFVALSRSGRGSPEQKAIAKEHLAVCFSCTLRNLAPYEASSLLLKEVHGFSTREIAETLDATVVQVKNWLQRGRRTLESRYARTCALVTKNGVCHQCVELDVFFNGQARDPLEGSARDLEARLTILRSRRDASLGPWHRAMLKVLDELLSSG
jgi:RNA polymerase sigma-70 factor (ECF subfamily)